MEGENLVFWKNAFKVFGREKLKKMLCRSKEGQWGRSKILTYKKRVGHIISS